MDSNCPLNHINRRRGTASFQCGSYIAQMIPQVKMINIVCSAFQCIPHRIMDNINMSCVGIGLHLNQTKDGRKKV